MHQNHTGYGIGKSQADQGDLDAHSKYRAGYQQREERTHVNHGFAPEGIKLRCPGGEDADDRSQDAHGQSQGNAASQQFWKAGRAEEQFFEGAEGVALR